VKNDENEYGKDDEDDDDSSDNHDNHDGDENSTAVRAAGSWEQEQPGAAADAAHQKQAVYSPAAQLAARTRRQGNSKYK
jgi:hypothetical protein